MTQPSYPGGGPRYTGGAIDLGEVKARAEARAEAEKRAKAAAAQRANGQNADAQSGQVPGIAPFFEVTPDNFEMDLVRRSLQVPVVVVVGTSRSGESERLSATFKNIAARGGLRFIVGYVDADAYPEIAQVFGVRALPTVLALAAGRPVAQFQGEQPAEALQQWVNALVAQVGPQLQGLDGAEAAAQAAAAGENGEAGEDPVDPLEEQATEALNRGDFDSAMAAYQQIIDSEPSSSTERAKAMTQARDTVKLLKRLDPANRGGEDPVGAADAAPDDVAKQFDAADAEVVAGAPERAFDRLVGLMTRSAGEQKTQVKDRLLELFALFDAADPRVQAARTKMASALF